MRIINKIIAAIAILATYVTSAAEEPDVIRPVYAAYTLEAGSAHVAETYLSPLRYSGWNVALSYERMQAMRFNPEHWVMQLNGRLSAADTKNNPARNADIWNCDFDIRWAMMHRWNIGKGFKIYAGGATGIDLGLLYARRNSNNPVAVQASWTVDATAMLAYNGTIGKLPFCARYQAALPLTGVFFAPAYGEMYYEIYLGNHRGLAHAAWPGNYFRLNNLLSVDLRFGSTSLRLGYRFDVLSTKSSDIVTRRIAHMATIGVAGEWISLSFKNKPNLKSAKTISAIY